MIFPPVRLSVLESEVAQRKETLNKSTTELSNQIRHKTKPLVFLTSHPKLILGTIFTFFSGSKLLMKSGLFFLNTKKTSLLWKLLKAGWMWKFLKMGLKLTAKKKSRAFITMLVQSLLTSFKKSKKK